MNHFTFLLIGLAIAVSLWAGLLLLGSILCFLDERRLDDGPAGWKVPPRGPHAVKGHAFGLDLSAGSAAP